MKPQAEEEEQVEEEEGEKILRAKAVIFLCVCV